MASLSTALPHDRRRPWPLWVSAGPTSTGVFLPVYLDAILPVEALSEGGAAFAELADGAGSRPEISKPRLREAWKGFEADLERERRIAEREASDLFAAERDVDAGSRLSEWTARLWSRAAAQATELSRALGV